MARRTVIYEQPITQMIFDDSISAALIPFVITRVLRFAEEAGQLVSPRSRFPALVQDSTTRFEYP